MNRRYLALVVVAALTLPATASAETQGSIVIDNAWTSPPPIPSAPAAGYMRVRNNAAVADRLLSVSSPRAGHIDMHEMRMEGSMMSMRALPYGVSIAAGGSFEFNEQGAHLMITGLDHPWRVGETLPVRLHFQRAGDIQASLQVRDRAH